MLAGAPVFMYNGLLMKSTENVKKKNKRRAIDKKAEIRLIVDSLVCIALFIVLTSVFAKRATAGLEPVYIINICFDIVTMVIGYMIYIFCMIDGTLFNNRIKYYTYLLNVVYLAIFTDGIAWLVNGLPQQRLANIIVNTIYYICMPVSCNFFWHYISEILKPSEKMRKKADVIVSVGMVISVILCVANLFFGQYFTVNELGEYHRSAFYPIHQIYSFFMILISLCLMIRRRKSLRLYQLMAMAMYVLAPLAVSILTVTFYGLSIAYPVMMCIMLLMYCVVNTSRAREQAAAARDMAMAATIQKSVLPDDFPAFPDRHEFELYASMNPAKEVGGDFYDFFLIDDDHLGLVIADVSGKGVPASLFMMISKSLLKISLQAGASPSEALRRVNTLLTEKEGLEMFVTIWVAVLTISTGEGVAANAGHEYPAFMRAGGRYEMLKYKHSPPVAVMGGLPFPEHAFKMERGDKLYVYTDGVCEAMNHKGELYGEERLIEELNRVPGADPEKVVANISESIKEFAHGTEQSDDITMLCIEYKGA